jgi:hypothetical protein
MDQNKGFSTNTLLNALRSIFEQSKGKFSTDMIQEIMNLITDIEHEVHLLQTNYATITKQNDKIDEMNSSMQEIFQRLASSQLPPISEGNENVAQKSAQTSAQTSPTGDNSSDAAASDGKSAYGQDKDEVEVEMMAELISDLVVKKLSELDAAE